MTRHISILISGKVQGVFFRASAKEKADELGIYGFVRNQPDGQVYIEAEGDQERLNLFEMWCKQGPRRADVRHTKVEEGSLKHFFDFSILR